MRIPLAIQSYRHRSLPVSAQRMVNWFSEAQTAEAKARVIALPTPGAATFATLTEGPTRGLHVMNDALYVVHGSTLSRVDAEGTPHVLGQIEGDGPVSMASNANAELAIVVPPERIAYRATVDSLARITDPDFLPAIAVDSLDGFGVFVKADSTEFFLSKPDDMLTFDALDFASAEGSPDNLVSVKRVGRELWFFGENTTEIWSNVGGADFPFERASGAFIERGCAAAFSAATGGGSVFWLGDDRCIYAAEGFKPRRISTHAIEQALAGYSIVNDARGWYYEQEGHRFYVLSFPDARATWVFDVETGAWHERESEGYGTWRCIAGVAFAGGVIAGDARNNRLYRVDPILYSEDGEPIRRLAAGIPLHAEGKRLFFDRFELDMETGTGLAAGQGAQPRVWLSHSNDGGATWSNQAEVPIGPMGARFTRAIWRRLGAGRNRVFRIEMSDPVRTALIAANIDAQPGEH
jgi:hypothetical protein